MALTTKGTDGYRYVQKTVTVLQPAELLYDTWRSLEALPMFMEHVADVTVTGPRSSHWAVQAPGGRVVEWDADIVDERPGERLTWRSTDGAAVENGGTVEFRPAPAGRGTEVRVSLFYKPPAGSAGVAVAKLFDEEPSQQLDEDLYRFKQLMETGRIVTTDGQPHG